MHDAAPDLSESLPEEPLTIEKSEINQLPLARYEGPIELIHENEQAEQAVEALLEEDFLGFDTETRPSFKKGESFLPSLLQLGGAKTVYLFQIKRMGGFDALLPVLESKSILKVGVAIRDDLKALKKIQAFEPGGFVEISSITSKLRIVNTGLRALSAHFLKLRISKRVQVSNWAKRNLSEAQVNYAATDAWISRELYRVLAEGGYDHRCAAEFEAAREAAKREKNSQKA